MARAPLLQLTGLSLTFGGAPLFADAALTVQPGERVALVGRNGSGKSTLMQVMAGQVEPDRGQRATAPGVNVGYMEQDPAMDGFATLGDFALADLDPSQAWMVDAAAEGLRFDPERPVATASGGERRRAALARLMASAPDLMLLDEPTNHLDITAIRWLEDTLSTSRAGVVMISHDRAFLRALTRTTFWIDRGVLRRAETGFEGFEAWRDKIWEDEDQERHKLDRKIKAEGRWAVEGISARRKRNMGRVRALGELRAERAAMIRRQGTAALAMEAGPTSGRRVIEARGVTLAFGDKVIVRGLDLLVNRGDRIAIVGPNGAGKTTLVKLLLGETQPDTGSVKLGTNLSVAVLDQNRAALNPDVSLWDSLTGDPAMRVSGQSDQVMVRGVARHVVGYLKDFLFDENQMRAPVRSLSGGEKARLLLARIMARESNLLILDEPTNDLDIETLDLLQDVLGDYDGTVLLVSHDRDFIDRVATQTIAMEGDGRATAYAGGWTDYLAQRQDIPEDEAPATAGPQRVRPVFAPERRPVLSFTERHRLDALPAEIDRLEVEIARLDDLLADPDMYTREPVKFRKATEVLTQRQTRLAAAEAEWLALAEKAEGG